MRDWEQYVRKHLRLQNVVPARESRIVKELASQFEDFFREAVARGMTESEADAFARAQVADWAGLAASLGEVDRSHTPSSLNRWTMRLNRQTAEGDRRRVSLIEEFVRDLGHGARLLRRSWGFAVLSMITLALGIGATTTIFGLVNEILLRSLPYPDADRIVMLRFTPPEQSDQKLGTNRGTFRFIREHSRSFEHIGELRITGLGAAPGSSDQATREWIRAAMTGFGVTQVMGVQPILGRWFGPADTQRDVVISHRLWQRMFGGDTNVLGQTLRGEFLPATIIGVMPPTYRTLDSDVDAWLLQTDDASGAVLRSPNRVFNIFARLKPGVTIAQAQEEMNALAGPLGAYMEMHRGWGISVDSLRDVYVGHLQRPVLVLQGAVVLLLLIACANVAGLLLAQGDARQKEFATRSALGSTRSRTIRQLVAENMLLSIGGGAIGLALAWVGLRTLIRTAFSAYPDLQGVTLDWTVLAVAALASLVTGLLFAVLPGMQSTRASVTGMLRESSRGLTASARATRIRGVFVVAQLGLALVLVVGAGLLVRSLLLLNAVNPGLDPRNVVTVQVPFPRALYKNAGNTPEGGLMVQFDSRFADMSERLRDRLATLPGVQKAAAAVTPPLGGTPLRRQFRTARGDVARQQREGWSAEWYPVSADYFDTLRIPVLRGRAIAAEDHESARPVVIINATMARVYWPDGDPIGQLLHIDMLDDAPREIVGVVGDVTQDRYQVSPQPQMYVPRAQLPLRMDMTLGLEVLRTTFLVRTAGDPVSVLRSLRAVVRDIDAALPIASVRTVEEYAAGQLKELSQYAMVLGLFGVLSVTLAVVGIVGVMAQTVGQRTNEFGVRLALGAAPGSVMALVLRHASVLVAIGLTVGLAGTFVLMPAIRRLLWGVSETDIVTLAIAVIGLAIVALAACYVPARRAMKVDPIVALRAE